jgi:hypothetical protein
MFSQLPWKDFFLPNTMGRRHQSCELNLLVRLQGRSAQDLPAPQLMSLALVPRS